MSAIAPVIPGAPIASTPDEIRVMVVDDAVVVRSLLSRWVEETPGLKLVAALRNGREALEKLDHARPDVVVLDVEMPELDGISTLPRLLERRRDLAVIMASALTRDDAEVTIKALSLGAADYIPKPAAEGGVMTSAAFQRELIEKIRALGARRKKRPLPPPYARRPAGPVTRRLGGAVQRTVKWRTAPAEAEQIQFKLRPFSVMPPRVLLIGASTGGPQALTKLVSHLDADHRGRAGADHPAHAADLHHHPRRASDPRRRQACARSGRWRAGAGRQHLSRAWRQAHEGRAPRRYRHRCAR